MKLILVISTASTASHLIDEVVPLAQITADINAIPRHKRQPSSKLKEEISTNDCLQVLYLVACGCMREVEDMIRFWRFMRFDFILMILSINQPLDDIQTMLSLLRTSVLETSFATIVSVGAHDQRVCEKHVINNMTLLLIDVPRVAEGDHPYDTIDVAELRLLILELMEKMSDTKHGGEALALDPYAVGRLVRVMNDELDSLYEYTYGHDLKYPSPPSPNPTNSAPRELTPPSQSRARQPRHPPALPPLVRVCPSHQHAHQTRSHPRRITQAPYCADALGLQ